MSAVRDIEAQAARWLARVQSQALTEQERAALEAWRASNSLHDAAFVRLEAVSRRMDRLAALRPPGEVPDPDLLAPERQTLQGARLAWLSAAAVILVVAGLGWWQFVVPSSYERSFATERGGFERAQLPDGSVVLLNTSSRVSVNFSAKRRFAELREGEASFDVAKDSTRPFVVIAGGATVRAVGTAFTVHRQADAARILVTEGTVAVVPPHRQTAAAPMLVTAGHAAIVERESVRTRVVSSDESVRALAWHDGMLSFDNDTLAHIVSEFNRYNLVQIEIADASIAGRRMGGYFRATNVAAFVGVLERQYDLQSVEQANGVVRLERTPK